jgi:predicted transcriptional regulator of viral defense system
MDFREVERGIGRHRLGVFSGRDLAVLFPGTDRTVANLQLHQWVKRGWIRRLRRGWYELDPGRAEPPPDLYIANRLYEPSYVSMETALSHWQLIPETAMAVTSVTTRPTRRFTTPHGLFTYTTVRPAAWSGVRVVTVRGYAVRMAEPGKALVDRLYVMLRRGERGDVAGIRWDRPAMRKLDARLIRHWADGFGTYRDRLLELVHALR